MYEWAAPGVAALIEKPVLKDMHMAKALAFWQVGGYSDGRAFDFHGSVKDLPAHEAEFLSRLGSLSFVAAPIFAEYQRRAFLMFDQCRRDRQWTPRELDAFQAAASIFGAAEARDLTSKKLIRRQLSMSLLNFIVIAALQAETLNEMAEIATDRLANLIGANGCFMTLWDEENRRAIPLAAYGSGGKAYSEFQPKKNQRTFT